MVSPEELIQLVQRKDQEAFRQLYELFKGKVFNTCLSYVQNAPDAEELTQDVFIEIFHSAGTFKGTASVNTWIYRIAVNKCLDKLRYQKRQKRFAVLSSLFHKDTGALLHDAPDFIHPGVTAERREEAAILMGAVQQLPESQQTVFILKQIEGLPVKEIAVITGSTEKAVESLLQRAKVKLRQLLENYYRKTKDNQ